MIGAFFFSFDKVFIKLSLYSRHWLDMQRGESTNNTSFHCLILDLPVGPSSLPVSGSTKDQVVNTGPAPIQPKRQRNQLIDWTGTDLL